MLVFEPLKTLYELGSYCLAEPECFETYLICAHCKREVMTARADTITEGLHRVVEKALRELDSQSKVELRVYAGTRVVFKNVR